MCAPASGASGNSGLDQNLEAQARSPDVHGASVCRHPTGALPTPAPLGRAGEGGLPPEQPGLGRSIWLRMLLMSPGAAATAWHVIAKGFPPSGPASTLSLKVTPHGSSQRRRLQQGAPLSHGTDADGRTDGHSAKKARGPQCNPKLKPVRKEGANEQKKEGRRKKGQKIKPNQNERSRQFHGVDTKSLYKPL